MSEPLVSIIIPVLNAEKYLEESIQSAIAQDWPNTEIIVVDNGSIDNSLAIAGKFGTAIKLISQSKKGASAARNLGFENAKGEYIQFLDADDILDPDKIKRQVEQLVKFPGHIAVCNTICFYSDKPEEKIISSYDDAFLFSTTNVVDFLIKLWGGADGNASMVQPNAWLIPRDVIVKAGKWNETLTLDDDGEFFTRIILNSKGIIKVEGVFNYYRKFADKNSLSSVKSYDAFLKSYESILLKKEELFKHATNENAKLAIAKQLIGVAVGSYPKYSELTKKITDEINKLGNYKFTPISGGPMLGNLSEIVGWKLARYLQYLIKSQ